MGSLDAEGNSLLHFACQIKDPTARKEIVERIARNAPYLIETKNRAGELPLQHARGRKVVSRLLANIQKDVQKEQIEPVSNTEGTSPPPTTAGKTTLSTLGC